MLFLGFNLGTMYNCLWLYKKNWKGLRGQTCTNPQCCGIKIEAQHQNVWIERVKNTIQYVKHWVKSDEHPHH